MDIHIGKPIANTQIYIVDKFNNLMPIGVTGELCIAGDCVGAGYLNRPELTAEKFVDNPFGEGKMYKTGDLAYWREDGNIAYVGRNDFQVKIRGLRIELGEIENAICQDENVSQAVVVVRKDENGRQLICAFYTEKAPTELKNIKKNISDKLPKYMMPHIFTVLSEMPLTSSGKINRKALPEVDLTNIESTAEYVAPKTDKEIALAQIISDILHIEKVGVLDNFFDLGGDSLKAIELIARLEQNGYKTSVKTVFDYDTVKDLAEQLEVTFDELEDIEIPDTCPATQAQMRVYTAQNLSGESVVYNVPYIFETKGVDIPKLENAFKALIVRHDALRTRFETADGALMQTVEKEVPFSVEVSDNADTNDFVKPFDLSKPPLMRVRVVGNTVMLDMHHIICDGSTMPVLLGELNELYMGRALAPTSSYMEYAVRQQNFVNSEEYKAQEEYWLNVFKEETEELTINTDKPRGQKQTFNGNCIYSIIDKKLAEKIEQKANEYKVTPFVYYMAALNILLSKFSGQEDIVIGMPASGRASKYLNTVGMFVNTVAMRNRPDGTKSLTDFIAEVKENSVAALANQDYPYGDLVKKLQIPASNRNPLFDVMFAYQSKEMTDIVFGDQKAELKPIYLNTAKYDMTFNVMPRDNDVVIMTEYCTDLYQESAISRMVSAYKLILEQMLDSKQNILEISAIDNDELQSLLYAFNDTAIDYPRDKCVHQLFEEQVAKTPNKTAVIACDRTLTYSELNEESNRIAHSLIEKGVKPNDIVAFMLPRKSYLLSVLFGILKSGAAYMPIDPDYPQDRIDYMLEDSKAKLCIAEDSIAELLNNKSYHNPDVSISSDSPCYCIYTSGSTGKPKGTVLTHANVVNYCDNNNNNVVHSIINETYKSIVSVTTVGFDIFVTESILPLTNGLKIILANESQAKMQKELNDLLLKIPVDVLQTTPTKMKSLISDKTQLEYLKNLKVIILGGEALDEALVEQVRQLTDAEIFNIYGPTEATVWVTNAKIKGKYNLVHTIFENQAKHTPNKPAVIACDKTLTYSELNEQSNRIAHSLVAKGVMPNDIVAFMLPRKSYLLPVMFGILKSGAAYMPIDPDYPQDRIEYMLDDSQAKLCITADNIDELLENEKNDNPSITVSIESNYCVIYTSGSTGKPKGCFLKHKGISNFCVNSNVLQYFKKINKEPVGISVNNVTFDYFIAENIVLLLGGFKTVLCSKEDSVSPKAFWNLCQKHNINLIQTTPTRYNILLQKEYIPNEADIKLAVTSGEALSQELYQKITDCLHSEIFNPLGPSECSVWVPNGENISEYDIHIGKPIANTQIYILDAYGNPTPIGVTGELCIAGDCVGAGYLNRPELTAEKFVDNPFGEGKMYKTGDLAYWREDGNIAYVGRNDFQVKIRGLRIELGEIENAICQDENVSQAVVIVRKDENGRQLICAFYTEKAPTDLKAIKKHISDKLPKYMMPHIFTRLDEMPLTSSGKINRKALPEVDLTNIESNTEYVKPLGEIEKKLAAIMEQVLNYSPVGLYDDFFDLGGDSLKAIELVSKAHNEGVYFDLQNVFDYPTVSALCEFIKNGDRQDITYNTEDFEIYDGILKKNTLENFVAPRKREIGNVLITGVTGFLGIHILDEYLKTEHGDAYCLIRGENIDACTNRFNDLLHYYFGDTYDSCSRIKIVCGDITEPIVCDADIDMVIHSAASVKHYGSYKHFHNINVEGTKNAIAFAKEKCAKLIHISTLSVSGNDLDTFESFMSAEDIDFSESSLYIKQKLKNVYTRSKFEAEKTVFDAMLDGLEANICRMGNLTNRESDAKFQPNYESNAAVTRLKAALEFGKIPDYLLDRMYMEFSPIDLSAQAVMTVARHFNRDYTVFHINSHKPIWMDRFIEVSNMLGIDMNLVSGEDFAATLREAANISETSYIFEAFINDMDEQNRLTYLSNIHIKNDFSVHYLNTLGFDWCKIDYDYMKKWVDYFRGIGYLYV